ESIESPRSDRIGQADIGLVGQDDHAHVPVKLKADIGTKLDVPPLCQTTVPFGVCEMTQPSAYAFFSLIATFGVRVIQDFRARLGALPRMPRFRGLGVPSEP